MNLTALNLTLIILKAFHLYHLKLIKQKEIKKLLFKKKNLKEEKIG